MALLQITTPHARELALKALRLEGGADGLGSEVALAASLRRSASFSAPIRRRDLISSVTNATIALDPHGGASTERTTEVLDRLLDHGDLLEITKPEAGPGRSILLRPPAYIETSAAYFLLGVRPEGEPLFDSASDLNSVEEDLLRSIRPKSEEIDQSLSDAGLIKVPVEQWVAAPRETPAGDLIAEHRRRLAEAPTSGEIEGLRIIDPAADPRYYVGRFREPVRRDDGCYVAKRPQLFGGDQWCFVSLSDGVPDKLIDLPLMGELERPADEAWRLQAAIDFLSRRPQGVRIFDRHDGQVSMDFFGPIPSWARKRLDLVGRTVPTSRGALFTSRLADDELEDQVQFLVSRLWMTLEG